MDSRMRVTSLTHFRVAQERLATTGNKCSRGREEWIPWAIAICCPPRYLGGYFLKGLLRGYWLKRKNHLGASEEPWPGGYVPPDHGLTSARCRGLLLAVFVHAQGNHRM